MIFSLRTRYLTGEMLWWIIGLYLGFIILMLGNDFFLHLQFFTQYQVPTVLILKTLLLKWPFWISLGIPVGVLFGTLIGIGRMAGDNEIQALLTSGVSIWRMSIPVFFVGLISSAIMWVVSERFAPPLLEQYSKLTAQLLGSQPMERIKPQVFLKGPEERVFYFQFYNPERLEMQGITVFQLSSSQIKELITAQSARQVGDTLVLSHVTIYQLENGKITGIHISDTYEISIKREILRTVQAPLNIFFMSTADIMTMLEEELRSPNPSHRNITLYQTVLHFKRSIPLSPLFLALLAFGLVARAVKVARYLALFYAIFLYGIYYILLSGTQIFASAGVLPPVVAGWMTTGLFSLFALFSLYKASR